MEHEDLIVSMKGIQKSFGGVHALTDGELTLRKGEVLGLIGENGAGKSTLMKILSGVYQADAGVMLVDGKEVHYHEPRQALHDGICMIYQDPPFLCREDPRHDGVHRGTAHFLCRER